MSKKMPAIKDLPKNGEIKVFYELPKPQDYKVYNSSNELIIEDHGEFINMTDLEKDVYTIEYGTKRHIYDMTIKNNEISMRKIKL
jgi:hypothetical protein